MPNGRGKGKAIHRRRTKVTSKGINGAKRHPLTAVARALLGKGVVAGFKPVEMKSAWRGASIGKDWKPAFPEQVAENRRLYPHLFPVEEA